MEYFGDESGHLKGVLQGDCQVCVIGVVAGERLDTYRCPKRTLRRLNDIPEVKWRDLRETEKRRMFECFASEDLQFGYAAFTHDNLESMDKYHLLYQDIQLPPAWDIALAGYAYGEILFELGASSDSRGVFECDRISSTKQSQNMVDHIEPFVPEVDTAHKGSRQVPGIQAADCLAGGIVEDIQQGTSWLEYIDAESVVDCKYMALTQLEHDLVSSSK